MNALDYAKQLIAFETPSYVSNAAVSEYVEARLLAWGFETELIAYDDETGERKVSVVARKGQGLGGFAYFGHTDVVPADDWFTTQHGPYEPTVVNDKLYGRGSCDMKGSVACLLAAIEELIDGTLNAPLYVVCTSDEEIGFGGAFAVVDRSRIYREIVAGQPRGVIGEPTRLEVIYAHKGSVGIQVTSKGRAAHSSLSTGVNANLAMIPFLAELKQIHEETNNDPAWQDDRFDPPTISLNIGINDHNHALNITAAKSICTAYLRPMPNQDYQSLAERIGSAAHRYGLRTETKFAFSPLYVPPDSNYVRELCRLAGRPEPRTVCYATDGCAFTEIEQLAVIGPGDIAQAHTHDEWITLDQLDRGTRLYCDFIQTWCLDPR